MNRFQREVAVEHNEVIIYHDYKDGSQLHYWYKSEDGEVFDIRNLDIPDQLSSEDHEEILKHAIERGRFSRDGSRDLKVRVTLNYENEDNKKIKEILNRLLSSGYIYYLTLPDNQIQQISITKQSKMKNQKDNVIRYSIIMQYDHPLLETAREKALEKLTKPLNNRVETYSERVDNWQGTEPFNLDNNSFKDFSIFVSN